VSALTSGLLQTSIDTANDDRAGRGNPQAPETKSACSPAGRTRQLDFARLRLSASHCSACCVQSAISVRPTSPSRSRIRAASSPSSPSTVSSTATRTRGTPVYGVDPLRLAGGLRPATATSAAGGCARLEPSPEGGVFSNDFLIPPALDRRLRNRSHRADRLGVLQVRVDRRHDDARLDGDEVDADEGDTNPGV